MSPDRRAGGGALPLVILAAAVASAAFLVPVAQTLRFDGGVEALLPERPASGLLRRGRASIFTEPDIVIAITDTRSASTTWEDSLTAIEGIEGVRTVTQLAGIRTAAAADADPRAVLHLTIKGSTPVAPIEEKLLETLAGSGFRDFELRGPRIMKARVARRLRDTVITFSLVAGVIAFIVATLCTRSLVAVLSTAICTGVGFVWALAAIAQSGRPITMATSGLIPLLPLIGVAFPMYVLARIQSLDDPATGELSPEGSIAPLRRRLGVLAAATLIGAMIHLFSSFTALRDFGLFASMGIACMGAATLAVIPASISSWLRPKGPAVPNETAMLHSRRIEKLGALAVRRGWALAFVGSAFAAVCIVGLWRSGAVADFQTTLGRSAKTTAPAPAYDLRQWSIRVGGREAHSIDRLETLLALAGLQSFVASQKGVVSTHSLVDVIATRGPEGSDYALPETQAEIDALLLQIEHSTLADIVDADFATTRIQVQTDAIDSGQFNTLRDRIEAFSRPSGWSRLLGRQARFPPGVGVSARGALVDLHRRAPRLKAEIVRGLAITCSILFGLMSIQFLSGRVGFLVVFLNLLAMVTVVGMTAWTGIGYSAVTAPLPSLLLGLTVGHTAYYFRALGADGRTLDCPTEALGRVVQSTGRPLVYAIGALLLGLAAIATSDLPALRWFGTLGAIGLLLAFVSNLLLLSSRVLNARIITMADFLNTRLGAIEEIPLFSGMRPFQAKLVVLSGRLATAAPGSAIAVQGESSSELYLLLGGKAEVRHGDGGPILGTVGRGDVVGEMGLLRNAPRSADVVATDSVEYLVLDGDLLERLRRQYPRTSAILLYNLTRILSDRLERATQRITALQAGA